MSFIIYKIGVIIMIISIALTLSGTNLTLLQYILSNQAMPNHFIFSQM